MLVRRGSPRARRHLPGQGTLPFLLQPEVTDQADGSGQWLVYFPMEHWSFFRLSLSCAGSPEYVPVYPLDAVEADGRDSVPLMHTEVLYTFHSLCAAENKPTNQRVRPLTKRKTSHAVNTDSSAENQRQMLSRVATAEEKRGMTTLVKREGCKQDFCQLPVGVDIISDFSFLLFCISIISACISYSEKGNAVVNCLASAQ